MLRQALGIYRRHFGALVLTCALSIVPANLLMAGAVMFGVASLGGAGVAESRTQSQQIEEKKRDLQEKPPPTTVDRDIRVQQLWREAVDGSAAFDANLLRQALPAAYAVLIAVAILLAGLALAHAAVVPLVLAFEQGAARGPAHAWAVVASRLQALLWTALLGVPLVALGSLFLLVPGVVLAIGFGFAVPVAMSEGLSGRAALQRSWALSRGHWLPMLGIFALIAICTLLASGLSVLAPAGPARAALSTLVRLIAYPPALVALVLLYERARRGEGAVVRGPEPSPDPARSS
jgi:hypothetical protein